MVCVTERLAKGVINLMKFSGSQKEIAYEALNFKGTALARFDILLAYTNARNSVRKDVGSKGG